MGAGWRWLGYLDIIVSVYQNKSMRTTLTIDDDIFHAVEQLAHTSGRRFGQVLSDLARKGLRTNIPEGVTGSRFPVFQVPHGAPVVTAAHLQQLIENED